MEAPRTHLRLGSATVSQLAFPGERQFEFPMGEIPWGQYSCKRKRETLFLCVSVIPLMHYVLLLKGCHFDLYNTGSPAASVDGKNTKLFFFRDGVG